MGRFHVVPPPLVISEGARFFAATGTEREHATQSARQ